MKRSSIVSALVLGLLAATINSASAFKYTDLGMECHRWLPMNEDGTDGGLVVVSCGASKTTFATEGACTAAGGAVAVHPDKTAVCSMPPVRETSRSSAVFCPPPRHMSGGSCVGDDASRGYVEDNTGKGCTERGCPRAGGADRCALQASREGHANCEKALTLAGNPKAKVHVCSGGYWWAVDWGSATQGGPCGSEGAIY